MNFLKKKLKKLWPLWAFSLLFFCVFNNAKAYTNLLTDDFYSYADTSALQAGWGSGSLGQESGSCVGNKALITSNGQTPTRAFSASTGAGFAHFDILSNSGNCAQNIDFSSNFVFSLNDDAGFYAKVQINSAGNATLYTNAGQNTTIQCSNYSDAYGLGINIYYDVINNNAHISCETIGYFGDDTETSATISTNSSTGVNSINFNNTSGTDFWTNYVLVRETTAPPPPPPPPPPPTHILEISGGIASATQMTAYAGQLFSDTWQLFALFAGVPLGFWFLVKIQNITLLKDKRGRKKL